MLDYYAVALLGGFAFLGGAIKYVDSVFDEGVFDKWIALLLTGLGGMTMGLFVILDTFAATILIAIVLGVALARKIDNPAFIGGTALVLAVPLFVTNTLTLQWFPLALLVFGGIIDEFGNNMVDSRAITDKFLSFFFHYRLTMEVTTGALAAIGVFPIIYWAALMFFDASYHLVGGYAARVKMASLQILRGEDDDEIWVRLAKVEPVPKIMPEIA